MSEIDFGPEIKSLESKPNADTNFYIELSKMLGTNEWRFKITRFAKRPEPAHNTGITIGEVLHEGCTFGTRDSALEFVKEFLKNV